MIKILQITSGRGPAECSWVVAQVLKVLLEEARNSGIEATVIHREKGDENRTLKSATVQFSCSGCSTFFDSWIGTIQWVGQSTFRKHHKRKNWFIGIQEVQLPETDFNLNKKDVRIRTSRASGPGGQHVNKVNTAVHVTHLPTGLSVQASEQRSQQQNLKAAMARLQSLLEEEQAKQIAETTKTNWHHHNILERGNPVKVFKGSDFRPKKEGKKNYKSKRQKLKNELKNELRNGI